MIYGSDDPRCAVFLQPPHLHPASAGAAPPPHFAMTCWPCHSLLTEAKQTSWFEKLNVCTQMCLTAPKVQNKQAYMLHLMPIAS